MMREKARIMNCGNTFGERCANLANLLLALYLLWCCRKWQGPGRYQIRYNQYQIDTMGRRRLLRYSLQVQPHGDLASASTPFCLMVTKEKTPLPDD